MTSLSEIVIFNALGATLIALLVAVIGSRLRRPAVVHALWLLVLVKLVAFPLVEVGLVPKRAGAAFAPHKGDASLQVDETHARAANASSQRREAQPADITLVEATIGENRSALRVTPATLLWSLLSAGAFLVLALAALRLARFERRLRGAAEAPAAVRESADAIARALGMKRTPRIRVVAAAIPPSLGPRPWSCEILLPQTLLERLSSEERDTLIAHELAHVRRRDHWVRLLELVVVALYWWHPVVWWARRNLRLAEEKSCDALVAEKWPGRARAYVEGLLKTIEYLLDEKVPNPGIAPATGDASNIEERVRMILQPKPRRALPRGSRALLLVAAIAAIAVSPGWVGGEKSASKEDDERDAAQKLEMIAVQREEMRLQRELEELELRRMQIEQQLAQSQVQMKTEQLRAKLATLEAEGQEQEAAEVRQHLAELEREFALHRKQIEFEQGHAKRRIQLQWELRELMMDREESMARGDEERARELMERMKLLEHDMQELHLEELRAEIERGRERLQQATAELELEKLSKP
ncbi:MAG: M48 family metalloprotease [Candidatus Latescibacterota bacterium]|nr:MAG: M48 family metalloprotease [Candidatus Latescibacterota bacterium]